MGPGDPPRERVSRAELAALLALIAAAALLRLATLDVQSFSRDEPFTVETARDELGSVFSVVKGMESTPPLYAYLAWGWEKLFGSGETGMRLLPALLGTLLVPATWAAARETLTVRAALIAALLVSVSPLLIWYSQEARAYALFALLATLGFLFFLRALRSAGRRDLVLWSVSSVLAMTTHYFAVLPIAAEGLWLLLAHRASRGSVALAMIPPVLTGVALLPLVRHQEENVPRAWAESFTLWDQLRGSVQEWAVGLRWTWLVQRPGVFAILGLALLAVVLLVRAGSPVEKRGALPAAVVALAAILPPAVISLFGSNLVASRNALAAWPLGAIVVAAGLGAQGARRAGALALALAGLCVVMLAVDVARPLEPGLQRDDWRALMEDVTAPVVAVPRGFENRRVAAYYLPGRLPDAAAVSVREMVVVGERRLAEEAAGAAAGLGFVAVDARHEGRLAAVRLRAPGPVQLPVSGALGEADLIVPSR